MIGRAAIKHTADEEGIVANDRENANAGIPRRSVRECSLYHRDDFEEVKQVIVADIVWGVEMRMRRLQRVQHVVDDPPKPIIRRDGVDGWCIRCDDAWPIQTMHIGIVEMRGYRVADGGKSFDPSGSSINGRCTLGAAE